MLESKENSLSGCHIFTPLSISIFTTLIDTFSNFLSISWREPLGNPFLSIDKIESINGDNDI
jgi:hypothetical protein